MQKFNSLTDTTIDTKLESLLLERKAPLSEDGMKKILEELTLYMEEQEILRNDGSSLRNSPSQSPAKSKRLPR